MSGSYLQYLKRALPLKQIALLLFIAVSAVTAGFVLYSDLSKDIQVFDNGKPTVVKTMGVDVGQALGQMGISVGKYDYVSDSMDTALKPNDPNVVYIKRAVPVNLNVDGKTTEVQTYRDTVAEVIKDNGIQIGPLDRYDGVTANDPIEKGMNIHLVRVKEEVITEEEQIPFDEVEQPNKAMNEGQTKTVIEGQNGIREKYYKLTYEDGRPINRTFMNEQITKEPVNRVVEYGTVPNFTTSRGDVVRYSKIVKMRATAYTNSFADCGKNPGDPGYGVTYSGLTAREGIIAVDPSIIPIGTKVYVEVPGSAPDYGFAIAADTGGAIKGKLIDLFFDSSSKVANWGVHNVNVYILNEQDDSRWKDNTNPCSK